MDTLVFEKRKDKWYATLLNSRRISVTADSIAEAEAKLLRKIAQSKEVKDDNRLE
jgi:hypothetical protein